MHQANPQGLPVPVDRWDQSTLNNNLPHGNDVRPQLVLKGFILQNPNLATEIVGKFRFIAQSRLYGHAGSPPTPLHIAAYNLLSQNYFNNPDFVGNCQLAVDFADFLVSAQGNNPQQAVDKAALKVYLGFLATVAGTHPQIMHMLDHGYQQEIRERGREMEDIYRDVTAFQQTRMQQPHMAPPPVYGAPTYGAPTYGTPAYGAPPAPQYGGYTSQVQGPSYHQGYQQQQQMTHIQQGSMAPRGYQSAPPMTQYVSADVSRPPIANSGGGRYADLEIIRSQPSREPAPTVTQIDSWTAGGPMTSRQPIPTIEPIHSVQEIPEIRSEFVDLPIPTDIDEVVVDPDYYRPSHMSYNPERPYDVIFNPGGIEIRPANSSGWKWKSSDVQPYRFLYDSENYVLFHVKWPDGLIQEKAVRREKNMEYIKHEIDQTLRDRHEVSFGKIVPSASKIIDASQWNNTEMGQVPVVEVKDDDLLVGSELEPVVLSGIFANSSDMENEVEAARTLVDEKGLESTDVLPAHEYQSGRFHPLMVSEECGEALIRISKSQTMQDIADSIRKLLVAGTLPLRQYRFINARLTKAVNSMLSNNLSIPGITIDSFVDDLKDLFDVLVKKYGPEMVETIDTHTQVFASRELMFVTTDHDEFGVQDWYINLQTDWEYGKLTSLSLSDGNAVVLHESTHPNIREVVKKMIQRNADADGLIWKRPRLITRDGIYLEVINGWLVKGAILLKRVDK